MPTPRSTRPPRTGVAWPLLLAVGVVVVGVVGFLGYLGWQSQERLNGFLEEGRLHIQNEKPELAAAAFQKADAEFGGVLTLYQKLRGWTGVDSINRGEVAELIVSAALLCAYDDFFMLKASPRWVELAERQVTRLPLANAAELAQNVATARDLSVLCRQFAEGKHAEVMKGLLAVEKNARADDQDFFLAEIRLLIACGKAMNEPAILQQARELLFFLTYEVGLKSKRLDQLWTILNR